MASILLFPINQIANIQVRVVVIARCRVQYGKYFPSFTYFATYFTSLQGSEIRAKYEKKGKYFPILHEATCNNYFDKYLLKSNVARATLHANCIELAQYNLILTLRSQISKHSTALYFNSDFSYSVHLFGVRWSFVLFQMFDYF